MVSESYPGGKADPQQIVITDQLSMCSDSQPSPDRFIDGRSGGVHPRMDGPETDRTIRAGVARIDLSPSFCSLFAVTTACEIC